MSTDRSAVGSPPTKAPSVGNGGRDAIPFFASPELSQRLDLLRHLTENSELVPVVVGVEGIGKSTLIRELTSPVPENWMLCRLNADLMMQPVQLLERIATVFGVVADEGRLQQRFAELVQVGQLPVIVIDDAHLLSEDALTALLRLLSHDLWEQAPKGRVLLFAQPEIRDALGSSKILAVDIRGIQILEMPLFSSDEAVDYIEHLKTHLPGDGSFALSAKVVDKIVYESGGIPGQILRLIQEQLPESESWKERLLRLIPDNPHHRLGIGIGVGLAVLLLVVNALFGGDEEAKPEQVEVAATQKPVTVPEPSQPDSGAQQDSDLASVERSAPVVERPEPVAEVGPEQPVLEMPKEAVEVEQAEAANTRDLPKQAPIESVEAAKEATPKKREADRPTTPPDTQAVSVDNELDLSEQKPTQAAQVEESDSGSNVVAPGPPETAISSAALPAESESLQAEGSGQNVAAPVVDLSPAVAITEDDPKPATITASIDDEGQFITYEPPGQQAENQPAPVVEIRPRKDSSAASKKEIAEAESTAEKEASMEAAPTDEEWLLKQDPGAYTLQLVGTRYKERLGSFLKRYSLPEPTVYHWKNHHGRPWHVILHGIYPDQKAALAARRKLPSRLKEQGVWPRTLESVQNEIKDR